MKQLVKIIILVALTGCNQQLPVAEEESIPSTMIEENTAELTVEPTPNVTRRLSQEEAVAIAETSTCVDEGELTDVISYNDYTKTWWIDMIVKDKEGCAPACVVSEDSSAEINWRCTGLLPE